MQTTAVETRLGQIPLTARPGVLGAAKPVVLVITGAWAGPDEMLKTPAVVSPDWDVVMMRLPGNGTPRLAETSIVAWARAVDELIDSALAGRRVVVLGLSVGALLALGLRSLSVRRIVAVEPPLATDKLWPMAQALRTRRQTEPADREFIEAVFGVTEFGVEPRRFHDLLEDAPPTDVLVGDVALYPERPLPRFPSFLDTPEREWLAGRPNVTLHVAPGAGHAIHAFAAEALRDVLMGALDQAR